jgi:hypothetical protein
VTQFVSTFSQFSPPLKTFIKSGKIWTSYFTFSEGLATRNINFGLKKFIGPHTLRFAERGWVDLPHLKSHTSFPLE